jgi:hypothetical protein
LVWLSAFIAVTSPLPSEGKSTVALNLAVTIAYGVRGDDLAQLRRLATVVTSRLR